MITEREGYEAMLKMLNYYYELTGSKDLTDILSFGEYIEPNVPADSAIWEYWIDAVDLVKEGAVSSLKVLAKPIVEKGKENK